MANEQKASICRRRATSWAASLGLLTCLSITSFPQAALAAFPGQNGKIAFSGRSRGADRNFEIFTKRSAHGGGLKRLTHNSGEDAAPSFAPGGNRIAFTSYRGGDAEIHVMRADGTHERAITSNPADDAQPAFSPSGKRIVFSSDRGVTGYLDLYIMRVDGSHLRRLTRASIGGGGDAFSPAFSPNGRQIAFERLNGQGDIYVMRLDGTHKRQLTYNKRRQSAPDFSPNGRQIAFESRVDEHRTQVEVFVMRADGTHKRRLTFGHPPARYPLPDPVFSPNGRKIAYGKVNRIGVMRADGSHKENLTHGRRLFAHVPSWGVR